MTVDVARFVRIFEPDPSDDFVTKRADAIGDLRTRFLRLNTVGKLMNLVSEVLGVFRTPPMVSQSYIDAIERSIKKQSKSFVRDDRELEMAACAMIAVVQAIERGPKARGTWATADVLATALWSGASFLPPSAEPKLEKLRSHAIAAARERIRGTSLDTRSRRDVADFKAFGDEVLDAEGFKAATQATINALRYNAALDREEIDILWWVLAATSTILQKPLVSLSPQTRAIATGLELGALLRGLPSQSHRNLSVRGLDDEGTISLAGIVEALGDERLALAANYDGEVLVDEAASAFPLLNAIRAGSSASAGLDCPRPLKEWCARAMLERAVLRVQYPEHRRV